MKLHEAMVEVLSDGEWTSFEEVAARIGSGDRYRRNDGTFAESGQLRRSATQSGGHYVHLFEVDGAQVRLRPS